MRIHVSVSLFIVCFLLFFSCSSTNSVPPSFTITTLASPAEAGTINPSNVGFEEGTSINLEAIANEGWVFQEWTGDLSSTENPLNYTVEENVNIIANFSDITSDYSVKMTMSDGIDEIQLEFGQHSNPANMSSQVPPSPPVGSLHAYFDRDSKTWWKDYRGDYLTSVTWNLRYQRGESESITLNWNIDGSKHEGDFILEIGDGSVKVNMKQESSIDLPNNISETIEIRYLFEK